MGSDDKNASATNVRGPKSALGILENLAGVDAAKLSPLQRTLLITDGTLTEILEAHYLEPIELRKLSQQISISDPGDRPFFAEPGEQILTRKINLCGSRSRAIYVYAESRLLIDRLSSPFRTKLMESEVPLGRLWLEFRLETFKELVQVELRPAGELCAYLDCSANSEILARTYDVTSSGKRLMRISEYFCVDGPLGQNAQSR